METSIVIALISAIISLIISLLSIYGSRKVARDQAEFKNEFDLELTNVNHKLAKELKTQEARERRSEFIATKRSSGLEAVVENNSTFLEKVYLFSIQVEHLLTDIIYASQVEEGKYNITATKSLRHRLDTSEAVVLGQLDLDREMDAWFSAGYLKNVTWYESWEDIDHLHKQVFLILREALTKSLGIHLVSVKKAQALPEMLDDLDSVHIDFKNQLNSYVSERDVQIKLAMDLLNKVRRLLLEQTFK